MSQQRLHSSGLGSSQQCFYALSTELPHSDLCIPYYEGYIFQTSNQNMWGRILFPNLSWKSLFNMKIRSYSVIFSKMLLLRKKCMKLSCPSTSGPYGHCIPGGLSWGSHRESAGPSWDFPSTGPGYFKAKGQQYLLRSNAPMRTSCRITWLPRNKKASDFQPSPIVFLRQL